MRKPRAWWRWIGGAAIVGGAALALMRTPRGAQVGLFLFHAAILEPGALEAFAQAGGKFLVVKVCDGTSAFRSDEARELVARGRALGLTVEGWGYHYCRTVDEAQGEGAAAASIARTLGLRRYYWDAEDEWAHSASIPRDTALAFLAAFRAFGPGLQCWWSSYSGDTYDGEPAADDPATALPYDTLSAFDGFAPQCYGTTNGPSSKRLAELHIARISKGLQAGVPVEPLFASGRRDANGNVWTPWLGPYGVLAVVRELGLKRFNFWYGSGSTDRIVAGGPSPEPPLRELIPLARAARPA